MFFCSSLLFKIVAIIISISITKSMAAARLLVRTATACRNPVFRLMSVRTQATSATPAASSAASGEMVFTFASPAEVRRTIELHGKVSFLIPRFSTTKRRTFDKSMCQRWAEIWVFSVRAASAGQNDRTILFFSSSFSEPRSYSRCFKTRCRVGFRSGWKHNTIFR